MKITESSPIACYKQFLLFSQCFQRTSTEDTYKPGLVWERVNSLPNENISDWSKLKAFADDKINATEKIEFGLGSVNNVGKRENAGYQHFLLFPQCFQKSSSSGSLKVEIV